MSRRRVPYPAPQNVPPPEKPPEGVPDHWVRMPSSMGMPGRWAPPEEVEEHIRSVNAILDQWDINEKRRRRGEDLGGRRAYRQDWEMGGGDDE
jgi:hypothetical protein